VRTRCGLLLVACCVLSGHGVASGSTSPTISLSVAKALPQTDVGVSGAGFAAGETVSISIDTKRATNTTADSTGAFNDVEIQIPAQTAPGVHAIAAAGLQSGGVAQATVVVPKGLDGVVVNGSFPSRALGGRAGFAIYLPPGYRASSRRYPVVYFLHGLPGRALTYRGRATLIARYFEQIGQAALVVVPEGARDNDADPEYHDWGPTRNWETALARELPSFVDRHFRTIPTRLARALIGVSAGGYGAMILGLHHLGSFSVIESWSGYFEPTDPSGKTAIDLGSPGANKAASVFSLIPTLPALLARERTYVGFYVGKSDTLFRKDNVALDAAMSAAGITHDFAVYPGGHSEPLWAAHSADWIGRALAHLQHAG
jgi:S-formylglutathione hydrolase FrmB